VERADVSFCSEDADCAAWLYRPDGDGTHPLIVMAHGFSATRDQRLDAYAERFCQAGIAALLFDYRHFGASGGEPRQLLDVRRQHADYRAAVKYARALEWVDPDRVALFGSSFSGGHVIALAAHDPRIAAIVSQCPFTDSLASLPKLGPVNMARGTVAALRDELAALTGRPRHLIPAVGPPGTFAVMSTDDAQPGFEAMTAPGSPWRNEVAGQIALRVAGYRPGRAASKLSCPALFCVCDNDSVAPAERTVALVSAAPRGEIKRYPVGHFEIYLGQPFEQAVADQTEFLSRHLVGAAHTASPA
jgi:fermentation-respiration switch protein FrsA (DUF1100 family)